MTLKSIKIILNLIILGLLFTIGLDCASAVKLNTGISEGVDIKDDSYLLLDSSDSKKFISIKGSTVKNSTVYLFKGADTATETEYNFFNFEENTKIENSEIILNNFTNKFNNNYLTFTLSSDSKVNIKDSIFRISKNGSPDVTNEVIKNSIVLTSGIGSIDNVHFYLGSGVKVENDELVSRRNSNSIYLNDTHNIGGISNSNNKIHLGGDFNKVIYYGVNDLLSKDIFDADKGKNHSIIVASYNNYYVKDQLLNDKNKVSGLGAVVKDNESAVLTIKDAVDLSNFSDFRVEKGATLSYSSDLVKNNKVSDTSSVLLTVNKFTIIDTNDTNAGDSGRITITGFSSVGELETGKRINILKVEDADNKETLSSTMFNIDYDNTVNELKIENGYVYLQKLTSTPDDPDDPTPDDPDDPIDPIVPRRTVPYLLAEADNNFGEYIANTVESLPYEGEEPTDILANAFIYYDDMIRTDPNNRKEYAEKAEDIVRTATPDQTGVLYKVAENNFKIVKNAVDSRIRDIIYAFDNKYTSYINAHWVDVAYSKQERKNNKDARKNYDVDTISLTLGKDYFLTRYYVLGAIYNFDFSKIKTKYREIDQMSYNLSFYSKYNLTKNFYATFVNGIFYNEYKETTAKMNDIIRANGTVIPLSTVFASPKHHSEQYSAVLSLNFNTTYLLFTAFANYNFISFDRYDDKAGQEIETRNVRTTRVGGEVVVKNIGRIDTKYISISPEFFVSANTLVGDNRKEFRITNKKSRRVSRIQDIQYTKDEETELKAGTRIKVNISHMSVDFGYNYATDLEGDYKAHNFNINFNYIY